MIIYVIIYHIRNNVIYNITMNIKYNTIILTFGAAEIKKEREYDIAIIIYI